MLQQQKNAKHIPMDQQEKNTIDPLGDGISSVTLIRASGSDIDVANAARVSYGKVTHEITDRDIKLITFLMNHNHTSPFEHNQLSFRIKCPLYIARQWMRHRMNSYNEISYRYVKAKDEFYMPPKWRAPDEVNKQGSVGGFKDEQLEQKYKDAIEQSMKTYEALLEAGVCREQARGLLPLCTYTEFIFTCNLHSLCHFLKLRLGQGAQHEIQSYAQALLKLALPSFPVSLGAWKNKYMPELDLKLENLETVLGDDAQ
ncbi:MAG: FAD-dependent thymidylate synthase [Candidatus Dependentiae bacterium]